MLTRMGQVSSVNLVGCAVLGITIVLCKEHVDCHGCKLLLLSTSSSNTAGAGTSKLLLAGEYSLYGCVQSMEKVRLLHSKRDTLLLSFNDAKVGMYGKLG